MDDGDLIIFLRDKTQLSRFSPDEVKALLDSIRSCGFEIKAKKRARKAEPMTELEASLRAEDAVVEGDE